MRLSFLAFLLSSSVAVNADPEQFKHFPDELCLAKCEGTGDAEVCTFTFTLNQGASELGYYAVDECKGVMPVLGMKKDVQYRFVQADLSNYYHPLGFAYFADGAHDDVDELEPSINPSGDSGSTVSVDFGFNDSVLACEGDSVTVNWQGYHNIQETKGSDCDSGDLDEVQEYLTSGNQRTYANNELSAAPGERRYFKCSQHCGTEVNRIEVYCPSEGSGCEVDNTCPAPMYLLDGDYLGVYSNIDEITPLTGDEDFGLDVYEPQFFASPPDWTAAGTYSVALKFDHTYTKDIFYFCHIHQFMTGRIKFVDTDGKILQTANDPAIPYGYEEASAYDQSCGTYGVSSFQLPNLQCPDKFVCDAPGGVKEFAGCVESMNCAMTAGMTTGASSDNALALFVHQMIPHHQNAVNMAKALLANGIDCDDIQEETAECALKVIAMEIITQQNHQIQGMYGAVEELEYSTSDDCVVPVSETRFFNIVTKKGEPLCMDLANRDIVLKECDGAVSQVWRVDDRGRIRSKKSKRCMTKQGKRIVNIGCARVKENDLTRGFDDTLVLAGGVVTPGKSKNGVTSLSFKPRKRQFGELAGPDAQEFKFVYIERKGAEEPKVEEPVTPAPTQKPAGLDDD